VKKRVLKESVLLLPSLALVAVVVATGVALAKDIKCRGTASCIGASGADNMIGRTADACREPGPTTLPQERRVLLSGGAQRRRRSRIASRMRR
jgi:hypothetical protein